MSKLYPGSQQVAPMKYANMPSQTKVDEVMTSTDWVLQEKYDGAWYQLEKTDDGEIYLFGRTLSKVTGEYTEKIANVPWLESWAFDLPNGTTLIGEIYIPGGHSNDTTKIMGCLPKKAIERQKEVYVQYMVFDCIRYSGLDLTDKPFETRYEILSYSLGDLFSHAEWGPASYWEDEHVKLVEAYALYDSDIFSQCETWDNNHWEKHNSFQEKLNEIFAHGGEGAVFKKIDCPYRAGKRTTANQMFKIKEHIDSIDLVVIDVLDPEMEYTGKELDCWPYWVERGEFEENGIYSWIKCEGNKYIDSQTNPHIFKPVTKHWFYGWKNALRVGAYNESGELVPIGTVASGLTDNLRADLAANPNNYIGHVCELSCMSVNKKDYTIRHGVFMRMRDDKDATDCKIEEIFA